MIKNIAATFIFLFCTVFFNYYIYMNFNNKSLSLIENIIAPLSVIFGLASFAYLIFSADEKKPINSQKIKQIIYIFLGVLICYGFYVLHNHSVIGKAVTYSFAITVAYHFYKTIKYKDLKLFIDQKRLFNLMFIFIPALMVFIIIYSSDIYEESLMRTHKIKKVASGYYN